MSDGLTEKEFSLLCENPPTYEALELEIKLLKAEIDDLNYRAEEDERTIINHEKEMDRISDLWREDCKKLEAFEKGIPTEKAKDGKDYLLIIKCGDELVRVAGHYCGETQVDCNPPFTLGPRWETDLNYRFYFYEEDKDETDLLAVYPLPPTETQMEDT